MTLENLLRIGQLHEHPPSAAEILRLLEAARRNLADAGVEAISSETRFDAAYKCIMQAALAALLANGYRPATTGGHHAIVQQALPKTIGLPKDRVVLLDALRKQRHLADYTGASVTATLLADAIESARALLGDVTDWLATNRPDLLEG